MAYTTISKSTDHFKTKLYTGNNSTNAITGVGFQPDLVWTKNRGSTGSHMLFDALRGATYRISSDTTETNAAYANGLTSFDSDGFTLGDWGGVNSNSNTFVSWNWKANGAGSANTDGSINTTATSVNTTAGISIVKYTGTGSNATIGHGLGVAPKMIIVKNLTDARSWAVYHASLGETQGIDLDGNGAAGSASSYWNDTAPTTSVFSIGTANNTGAAQTYIAYCFAEKIGFSKFGRYFGNGNNDGPFLYCGFKPAFVVYKKSSDTGDWQIFDNKRDGYNNDNDYLQANANLAEQTTDIISLVSNGFKVIGDNSNGWNKDGSTYIWWAFAEAPLVGSNNEPCKAR